MKNKGKITVSIFGVVLSIALLVMLPQTSEHTVRVT